MFLLQLTYTWRSGAPYPIHVSVTQAYSTALKLFPVTRQISTHSKYNWSTTTFDDGTASTRCAAMTQRQIQEVCACHRHTFDPE